MSIFSGVIKGTSLNGVGACGVHSYDQDLMQRLFTGLTAVFLLLSAACSGEAAVLEAAVSPTPGITEPLVPTVMPPQTPTAPATTPVQELPAAASTALPTDRPQPTPANTAEPPQPLTFAVIGDYGLAGQGTQDVANLIAGWEPDLVLTVGDNNYPDGATWGFADNVTQYFGRYIDEGRFFPVLGNHDMTTDNGQPYLDYFDLPGNERYYDFVQGDVHFFAINSDWREPDGIRANSRQAQWLQTGLAASTAPWQVVYLHVPPYVSMVGKEVPVLRWPFAEWGADLVLSGHAHLYERLDVGGLTYVVNGLGGTAVYAFDEEIEPGSQVRFNADYGALLIEGTAGSLSGQFITRGGVVVDSFVITNN